MTPNLSPQVQEWRKKAERLATRYARAEYEYQKNICGMYQDARDRAKAALLAHLSAVPAAPQPPTKRSDRDYAIEHAEYMAVAGEHLLKAVNVLASAEENNEPADEIEDAQQTVNEATTGLRSAIYEFRKRRDRAASAAPQRQHAVLPGERRLIDANELERIAKERPDGYFLKGSGVLKLIGGIRQLEATIREMSALAASPQPAQPGEALPAEQPKSDESYAVVAVGSDLPPAQPEA